MTRSLIATGRIDHTGFTNVLLADEAIARVFDPSRVLTVGDVLDRFGDEGTDPHQDPIEIGEGE